MEGKAFAHVLHAELASRLAGAPVLARGRRYLSEGRVERLVRSRGRLTANVRGGSSYDVAIWVTPGGIGFVCSCPAGDRGEFCKHCVAVALAWLAQPEASRPRT